jgi:hypothetical protein
MRKIGKIVKSMRIDGNCIIAIKAGSKLASQEMIDNMVYEIEKLPQDFSVLFCVVEELDDIKLLDEDGMAQFGWFKIDALKKKLHIGTSNDDEIH